MARLSDAFIDNLLARTDIVELINQRVPLKRQGKEYASRCPFHDERSASFTVSPTKQFYHCFGCGANGTAIGFLMNYDRLEFLDAIEELANRAGIELPQDTHQATQNDEGRELYTVLETATRFFQQHLYSSAQAQAYLKQRGVENDNAERFSVGYAPDNFGAIKDTLGTNERRLSLLDRAGLLSKNDRGHVYDKFRDRIIFPIHDRRGRVIAFGGRLLGQDGGPKYLNSPETPLFHKGRELYGLWQVRQANQKVERLIVVEGYMDVMALFQYGITQAVATLGTATTPDHAELLFRNAPDIYFCFDGDRAGRQAAWRAVESILPRMRDGRQAFFLFLPDGEDPDSIVRKENTVGFEARLQGATPLSSFFFDELSRDVNLNTLDGKARLVEHARPMLDKIPDGAFAELMQQQLVETTGVSIANAQSISPVRQRPALSPQRRSLVRSAITLILQKPALALTLVPPHAFASLRQPGIELLMEFINIIQQRPDISTAALLECFAQRPEQEALFTLAVQPLPGEEALWANELHDTVFQLEKMTLQQRVSELQAKQRSQGELDEVDKYELRLLLQARMGQ